MGAAERVRRGPVPGPMGAALARVYRLSIARINRRFDSGRGVVRFDRPVISVGNLSVGGTGKTPMVRHIVRVLLETGHRPCIAMRGYKGRDGRSDEAAAYQREFPDVPVIARANRTDGLIALFGEEHDREGPHRDCIVLDDGFQHRQIGRELDIVLIDTSRSPFEDRLLPAGWLREPVESLARAGMVVITHAESVPTDALRDLEARVRAVRGRPVEAITRHRWTGLDIYGQSPAHRDVSWLRGKRVLAVCAIGNPGPFLAEAGRATGLPLEHIVLRDHDAYAAPTVNRIIERARALSAEAIVVTAKDWEKLESVRPEQWPAPLAVARLELTFDRGDQALTDAVCATVERGVPEHDETA